MAGIVRVGIAVDPKVRAAVHLGVDVRREVHRERAEVRMAVGWADEIAPSRQWADVGNRFHRGIVHALAVARVADAQPEAGGVEEFAGGLFVREQCYSLAIMPIRILLVVIGLLFIVAAFCPPRTSGDNRLYSMTSGATTWSYPVSSIRFLEPTRPPVIRFAHGQLVRRTYTHDAKSWIDDPLFPRHWVF